MYLKNTKTGEVFPFNEALYKRGDMVEVEAPVDSVEPIDVQPAEPKKAKSSRASKNTPAPDLDKATQDALDGLEEFADGLT